MNYDITLADSGKIFPEHVDGLLIVGRCKFWAGQTVVLMACSSTPDSSITGDECVWMRIGHGGYVRNEKLSANPGTMHKMSAGEIITLR